MEDCLNVFFYLKEDDGVYYPDNEHAVSINQLDHFLNNWKQTEKYLGTGEKIKKELPEWTLE